MDEKPIVVAFKVSPTVVARIDELAAAEGATRAGVTRRLVIHGLGKPLQTEPAA